MRKTWRGWTQCSAVPPKRKPLPPTSATPVGSVSASVSIGSAGSGSVSGSRQKIGGSVKRCDCELCRQVWETPNPIVRHKSATLPRRKGYGPRCDICDACVRNQMKGEEMEVWKKKVNTQEGLTEWMAIFNGHVDARNNGRHFEKSMLIKSVDAQTTSSGRCLGNFWPREEFESYH